MIHRRGAEDAERRNLPRKDSIRESRNFPLPFNCTSA